jgi:hypothetical protein
MAICELPSVPFLKPTGMLRPLAIAIALGGFFLFSQALGNRRRYALFYGLLTAGLIVAALYVTMVTIAAALLTPVSGSNATGL